MPGVGAAREGLGCGWRWWGIEAYYERGVGASIRKNIKNHISNTGNMVG